jgi:hypothetical protein
MLWSVELAPKSLEPASEQGTSDGEQMTGSFNAPEHAGLFEALSDDRFTGRFDNARPDEVAVFQRTGTRFVLTAIRGFT